MKYSDRKYLIFDSKNKLFWKRTDPYGYGAGNKQIYEAIFTPEFSQARLLSKEKCEKVFRRLCENEFITKLFQKINVLDLKIKVINITFEIIDEK